MTCFHSHWAQTEQAGQDCVPERNGAVSSIGSDENSPVANVNHNGLLKY